MAKANFKPADIRRHLNQGAARIEEQIIIRLRYLAEATIAVARQTNSYLDQTGNLRSSIGYLILKNGKVIDESFEQVKEGSEGTAAGRKHARQIAGEYPRGFVLVVVAGMHYGAVLESRGIDVLSSAEQYAKSKLPEMLQKLKKSVASL
ncbi:MAG TPA: hypothetical protein VN038_15315 [Dyadobacter sp.]|nr:hypothetical protein [Dyadobacter sp.]